MNFKLNKNLFQIGKGYIGTTLEKEKVQLGFYYYEPDNCIPVYSFTEETLPDEYYLQRVIFKTKDLTGGSLPLLDLKTFELLNASTNATANAINYLIGRDLDSVTASLVDYTNGYLEAQKIYKWTDDDMEKLYKIMLSNIKEIHETGKLTDFKEALEKVKTISEITIETEKIYYPKDGVPTKVCPHWCCIFDYQPKLIKKIGDDDNYYVEIANVIYN